MTQLHQILAVVSGRKAEAERNITSLYKLLQSNRAQFDGHHRTYRPATEDGAQYPDEALKVRFTVPQIIRTVQPSLAAWYDAVATQECSNQSALADVVVDGAVVLPDVPVTLLLFLEKRLVDLASFIRKMPVLDSTEDWKLSDNVTDCYESEPFGTAKEIKTLKPVVMYEATTEHPAQVKEVNEVKVAGTWTNKKFTGAISEITRDEMLQRCNSLLEAVKVAREFANSTEITDHKCGQKVLEYIFG